MVTLSIFFVLVIIVGHDIVVGTIEENRPTYYENGADFPLDDLPPSARNVHFRKHLPFDPWGRSYEFDCTENDFLTWASKKREEHPELSPIRTELTYGMPVILKNATVDSIVAREVLISDWTYTDQGLYVVYDRDRGRAITWSHSR